MGVRPCAFFARSPHGAPSAGVNVRLAVTPFFSFKKMGFLFRHRRFLSRSFRRTIRVGENDLGPFLTLTAGL